MSGMQLMLFDYQQLDAETRIVVQQRTSEIKALMKKTAQDIIEIGEKLIEVKDRLPHGEFGGWLESEFEWKERTAQNFMLVADKFKFANFADLQVAPSALYLLAAPSTPDEARAEALERAERGEAITHKAAKEIVQQHKPAPSDDGQDRGSDGLTDDEWVEQKMNILKQKLPPPDSGIMQSTAPAQPMALKPLPEADPCPEKPPLKLEMTPAAPPDLVITMRVKMDRRLDVRPVLVSLAHAGEPPLVMKSVEYATLPDELAALLAEHGPAAIAPGTSEAIEKLEPVPVAMPDWLE